MHRRRFTRTLAACFLAASVAPVLSSCAETSTSESTGQYIDDATITTKVKAKLLHDQALKGFQIHVETYKGVVELSGFVDSPQIVSRASQVASSVEGVKSVRNNLAVK